MNLRTLLPVAAFLIAPFSLSAQTPPPVRYRTITVKCWAGGHGHPARAAGRTLPTGHSQNSMLQLRGRQNAHFRIHYQRILKWSEHLRFPGVSTAGLPTSR